MKLNLISTLFIALMFSSCGSEHPQEAPLETPSEEHPVVEEVMPPPPAPPGMAVFQNMEIIEYCTLIPDEYEEDQEASEKAGHAFNHKSKKNNSIEVKGLLRANSEVTLEEYMKGTIEDAELEGKIIQKKELSKELNCFYTKGYYNNSIHESRFIEVCWLRRDDVVKYSTYFDIADTLVWNDRLKKLVAFGSECK